MKKLPLIVIISIIILVAVTVALFFLPVDSYISKTPLLRELYNNSSLSITSRNGKASVTINGEKYGETPLSLSDLPEGTQEVTIERISDSDDFYKAHNFSIDLVRDTEAVIDIEIGPDDSVAGYVLFYSQSPDTDSNSGFITITCDKSDCSVYLENDFFGKAPITTKKMSTGKYNLKIVSPGCETIEFPVIVRNGFILNVNTKLFTLPVTIEES